MGNKIENRLGKMFSGFDAGVIAEEVGGKRSVRYRAEERFFTASISKIITAISLYRKLEESGRSDSAPLYFGERDKVGGSGILQYMSPYRDSIGNFLTLMLGISDNTASDLLFNFVGKRHQEETIRLFGLSNTFLRQTNRELVNGEFDLPPRSSAKTWERENIRRKNVSPKNAISLQLDKGNVSTPADYAKVLRELVKPQLISKKSARKIVEAMKTEATPTWLVDDLGYGVPIARKPGGMPSIATEAAIVFAKKPFIIVFMGKNLRGGKKNEFVERCNKATHELAAHFRGR